jgi:two-component system, OmpR family, sensor kinase
MSVKARLSLGVVVLLVAAIAIVGWVFVNSTRASMTARIDDRLVAAATRPHAGIGDTFGGPPPEFSQFAELGYDGAVGKWGRLVGPGPSADPYALPDPPDPGTDQFSAMLEGPVTVDAEDGSLEYRAIAVAVGEDDFLLFAESLADVDHTVDRLLVTVLLTGAAVVALGALGSWWVVQRSLRPVDRMIDTAAAIAGGDLTQRVEYGDDGTELGRLASALDDMLGQLELSWAEREASQARLRQFVADASHELRTPVAAIRGYAELYRQGGLASKPSMERAMHRIETESERVGHLVDDLLLLARLDQHQPLQREPVDVSEIARDSVAGFRVIDGSSHPLALNAASECIVVGDQQRLRQVIDNLVGNAFAHTPAGTPVEVSVANGDGHVALTVVDHGPGIPEAERARVFERFHRIDTSRSRHTGGTGLGLAIVAAVASAHGGTVELDEPDEGGCRFTVRLPTAPVPVPEVELVPAPSHS